VDTTRAAFDLLGRPLRDLRISVIDSCNLFCSYCRPRDSSPGAHPPLRPEELCGFGEILSLVRALRPLGLKKIKITGGEPLLRPGLPDLVRLLKAPMPDLEVDLTTNGSLLEPLLGPLKEAGLDRINISLDSLDPDNFARISGGGRSLEAVLRAIEAAPDRGFSPVKINMVVIRGENDHEVEAMAARFRRPGFILRFIEFMDAGTVNRWSLSRVVPSDEILDLLRRRGGLSPLEPNHPGETARRWAWEDDGGEIGFISSVTRPFCGHCSRLRLGPDGGLYTCLFADRGRNIRGLLREGAVPEITRRVAEIWRGRSDRYSELRAGLAGETVDGKTGTAGSAGKPGQAEKPEEAGETVDGKTGTAGAAGKPGQAASPAGRKQEMYYLGG